MEVERKEEEREEEIEDEKRIKNQKGAGKRRKRERCIKKEAIKLKSKESMKKVLKKE